MKLTQIVKIRVNYFANANFREQLYSSPKLLECGRRAVETGSETNNGFR